MGSHFVGREAELSAIARALDGARTGRGQFVLLEGEPGIGKTRLAREALRRAAERGLRVAEGRAWEGPGAPAFFVWRELFRSAGESLAMPETLDGDAARFAALEAIAGQLRALARGGWIFLLDDLQWADAASLLALRLVTRGLGDDGALVVATVRDASDPATTQTKERAALLADLRREATVLPVRGLAADELAELARDRGIASDSTAGAILRTATGGNPLYAGELLDDAEARAAIARGTAPRIPRTALGMVARHLTRLEPEDQRLVAIAALGPQPTVERDLAAAAGATPSAVDAALDAAVATGIMMRLGDHLAGFSHDLFRQAARESLPRAELPLHHEAWARALRGRGDERAAEVVFHLAAADPSGASGELGRAAIAAAEVARRRFAYEDAAALLEQAASAHERAGREAPLADALVRLAEVRFDTGDTKGAALVADRALALGRGLGDSILVSRAALALARRRTMSKADLPLAALLEEALAGLDANATGSHDEVALRCLLEARLACALQPDAAPDRALVLARAAIARARETGDRQLSARVLHAARPAFRIIDDLDERLAMDRELLDLAEQLADEVLATDAHARLLRAAIECGDAALIDAHLGAYEKLATKLRLPDHTFGMACAKIMLASMRGDTGEAARGIDALAASRSEWAPRLTVAAPIDPLVMARFGLGVAANAPRLPDAARAAIAAAPTPPLVRAAFGAFMAVRTGHVDAAKEHYETAVTSLDAVGQSYLLTVLLGEACVAVGDRSRASFFYQALLPFAGRQIIWVPFWVYDGAIERLLGGLAALLGHDEAARAHFEQGIADETAIGAAPFAARTSRDRDRLLGGARSGEARSNEARALSEERSDEERARSEARPVDAGRTGRGTVPSLVREGDTWLVTLGRESARLKDADGLHYLQMLVLRAGIPISSLELFHSRARAADDDAPPRSGDAGEVLDARAVASYRARAAELRELVDEALERNDRGALEAARRELAFLETELARAVGLGGRPRRAASEAERVRVNVTTRIRKSIARLREHAPGLADHLGRAIRTGATCVYTPPIAPE